MIKTVKRLAYAGSSAICGLACYASVGLGLEYKAPVPFVAATGFGLASWHMAKKAVCPEKKKNDCCHGDVNG